MQRKLAGVPEIRQLPLNELEFVSRVQFKISVPSTKNQRPIHKIPAFYGRNTQNGHPIHKIPAFHGRNTQNDVNPKFERFYFS